MNYITVIVTHLKHTHMHTHTYTYHDKALYKFTSFLLYYHIQILNNCLGFADGMMDVLFSG